MQWKCAKCNEWTSDDGLAKSWIIIYNLHRTFVKSFRKERFKYCIDDFKCWNTTGVANVKFSCSGTKTLKCKCNKKYFKLHKKEKKVEIR